MEFFLLIKSVKLVGISYYVRYLSVSQYKYVIFQLPFPKDLKCGQGILVSNCQRKRGAKSLPKAELIPIIIHIKIHPIS